MAEPFTTLIADPNPRVRDAAILALGRLRAASAIAVIADQLGATDAAVTALQSFGPAAEKDALMLASSPNKLVRAAAAQVLITAATPQNLELVQRLAADEDRAVAAAALQAWKRLVPADFTPLQEALRDLASSDVLRQHAAIEKLTELEPDEHRSKVAMHLVVVALGDNADLRLPAAKALESWGTRDALLVLVQALGDYDALKRERAKEMLGYLKDPSAIDPITDLAEKGNTTAVETLAAMGPIAEEGALRLLNCENSAIQLAAVRALGDIGTRRSVLPLGALMRSRPNHLARQEEREALRKINLRITDQAREEARRKIRTVPTSAPTAGQD
jgi:HEAT repeat protein